MLLRELAMPAEREEELVALLHSFAVPGASSRVGSSARSAEARAQARAEQDRQVAAIIGYERLPLYEDFMDKLFEYSQVS